MATPSATEVAATLGPSPASARRDHPPGPFLRHPLTRPICANVPAGISVRTPTPMRIPIQRFRISPVHLVVCTTRRSRRPATDCPTAGAPAAVAPHRDAANSVQHGGADPFHDLTALQAHAAELSAALQDLDALELPGCPPAWRRIRLIPVAQTEPPQVPPLASGRSGHTPVRPARLNWKKEACAGVPKGHGFRTIVAQTRPSRENMA